ncbi:hypothetical protein M9434_000512 [Picochlorum sp. BPE23]|nr:hypothetical protein M9434_000512 [Picochlorum sp. BPE23]
MFENVTTGCRVHEHFVVGDGQSRGEGGVEEDVGATLFESMSRRFKKRLMDVNARKGRDRKRSRASPLEEGEGLRPDWCGHRGAVEGDFKKANRSHTTSKKTEKVKRNKKEKNGSTRHYEYLGGGSSSSVRPRSWCGMAVWNDDTASQKKHDSTDDEDMLEESRNEPDGGPQMASHVNVKSAWLNAAMAWRQKNMPSPIELKKRKAEMSRRMSEAARKRHAKSRPCAFRSGEDAVGFNVPEKPADDACEADWKVYFRLHHSARIARATSFVQVLRTFDVPCVDPKKIKFAYMQAVRMYHPDSNSKSRCWSTAREKVEAEEIMKLINQRKPDDFSLE